MSFHPLIITIIATTGLCQTLTLFRRHNRVKHIKVKYSREDCVDALDEDTSTRDFFNELPDEIILHILSSLPLKEFARTTILSRRWMRLHASLPNLNFDLCTLFTPHATYLDITLTRDFCKRFVDRFVGVVDRSMKNYASQKILSFKIAFCYQSKYARNVDRWVRHAVELGVEKLYLDFVCCDKVQCEHVYDYTRMKFYVFSCKKLCEGQLTLKHLRLHSCIFQPHLSANLHTLTTLDLNFVALAYYELDVLLFGCRNLEWLRLRGCHVPSRLRISRLFSLKFLSIAKCKGLIEIEISANNLATFEFSDFVLKKMFFYNVPKLENAFFYLLPEKDPRYTMTSISEDLPNLKVLSIRYPFVEASHGNMPVVPFARFNNVLHLNLSFTAATDYDLVTIITPLLKAFPQLQSLYIKLPPRGGVYQERETRETDDDYSHKELREVELADFTDISRNMALAMRLGRIATELRQLTLSSSYKLYDGCGEWVYEDGQKTWSESRIALCRWWLVAGCSKLARVLLKL